MVKLFLTLALGNFLFLGAGIKYTAMSNVSKNMSNTPIQIIVIGAAGRGTRLKHLTQNTPKHLLIVAGQPFLHYVLASARQAGFAKIIVVIGYLAEQMESFLNKWSKDFATEITIVNQPRQVGNKVGTAAVVEAVEQVVDHAPFVFVNGDSLYASDVYAKVMANDGWHRVVGAYHDDPTHYGVIEVRDGLLERVVEKPKQPLSHFINLGLYAFQPEIFTVVKKAPLSARGEYEIVDALNVLAQEHKVKVEQLASEADEWVDLGQPGDIARVEQYLREHYFSK